MILIFFGMLVMLIMIDPTLGNAVSSGMNELLYPAIGFGGRYPIITLVIASLITVTASTIARHVLTDWTEMARIQKQTNHFNKELREATMAGDMPKVNRLKEYQPKVMEMNSRLMFSNLKPMVVTLLVAILIFRWLWAFFDSLDPAIVSLPWNHHWNASRTLCLSFKSWILLYMFLSIPTGQVLMRALKVVSNSQDLKRVELDQMADGELAINALQDSLVEARKSGIPDAKAREMLSQAKRYQSNGDFKKVRSLCADATEELERSQLNYERTKDLFAQSKDMVDQARKKGIGVSKARSSLDRAKKAMDHGDSSTAIFHSKQAQKEIKDARVKHQEAEENISILKSQLFDMKDISTENVEMLLQRAQDHMKRQEYQAVLDTVKKAKRTADDIKRFHSEAKKTMDAADKIIKEAKIMGARVEKAQDILIKARYAYDAGKYEEANVLSSESLDMGKALQNRHRDAQDAVNFAQLVITNAEGFGADVSSSKALFEEAKRHLEHREYDQAISKANAAKEKSEEIKRQVQRGSRRG